MQLASAQPSLRRDGRGVYVEDQHGCVLCSTAFRGQRMAVTLMMWLLYSQAAAAVAAAAMAPAVVATVALRGTTQKSPRVICL